MKFVREDAVTSVAAPGHMFRDGVWAAEILKPLQPDGMRAHRFTYRPGTASHWHTHDGEQAIVVVSGRGVVTRWGEAKGTEIGPGDWVHVLPGEKHWHGSLPDEVLVHLAITATGGTNWHEQVSEDEYRSSVP